MLVPAFAAAIAAAAGAQETTLDKIPRPVYFPAARIEAPLDAEGTALVAGVPEMLATLIAEGQPFTRTDSADTARSVVTVSAASGGSGRVTVAISLVEDGEVKSQSTRDFAVSAVDLVSFRDFVAGTAARLAPSLGPVEPVARALELSAQRELVRVSPQKDPVEELDKRFDLTLWASGLLRVMDSTGVDRSGFYFGLDILPLIAEASWFFSPNLGLQLSFYFNDTNAFDFGNGSRHNAYGLFLFPGAGLVFRTLGEVSGEVGFTFSLGWIRLTATSGDVVDRQGTVVLSEGSSVWSGLTARLRVSPAVSWNITPSVAIKAGLGLDLVFPGMFSWYGDSPLGDLQYLTVGAAYRF
jgi:hypothetical protein